MFNINDLKAKTEKHNRYRRQLERITAKNGFTQNIEQAVDNAVKNIKEKYATHVYSFLIKSGAKNCPDSVEIKI